MGTGAVGERVDGTGAPPHEGGGLGRDDLGGGGLGLEGAGAPFSHFPERGFLDSPALHPSEHGICHRSPHGWHWFAEQATRAPFIVEGHFPEQHAPQTHAAHGLHDPPSHSFAGVKHLDPTQHCCHVPPHSWLPACSRTL